MSFIISPLRAARPHRLRKIAIASPYLHFSSCCTPQHSSSPTIARNRSGALRFPKKSSMVAPSAASPPSPTSVATQRSQAIAGHFSTSPSSTNNTANMNLYSYSKTPSEYTPRTVGQPYTLDYRCYIEKNGQPVSPFHDIPLYANEQQTILNMVVEIPRWSNAKQEVGQTGLERVFTR